MTIVHNTPNYIDPANAFANENINHKTVINHENPDHILAAVLGEMVKCEKEVYKTHDKSIQAQKYIERSANTSLTDVMEEAHHQGKIVFRLNWNLCGSLRSHLISCPKCHAPHLVGDGELESDP